MQWMFPIVNNVVPHRSWNTWTESCFSVFSHSIISVYFRYLHLTVCLTIFSEAEDGTFEREESGSRQFCLASFSLKEVIYFWVGWGVREHLDQRWDREVEQLLSSSYVFTVLPSFIWGEGKGERLPYLVKSKISDRTSGTY